MKKTSSILYLVIIQLVSSYLIPAPPSASAATEGAPVAPTLASPSDGATNLSTSPTLTWNVSSGASAYRLQVATDSSFSSFVFDDSTLTDTSKEFGPLYSGATYFWRVSATNSAGTSAWSQMRSFVTEGAAPALTSPQDGLISGTELQLLVWDTFPDAVKYWVLVSSTPDFSADVYYTSATETSLWFGAKSGSRTYYWRVRALFMLNGSPILSPWSTVRSFQVSSPRPRILFRGSDISAVRDDRWANAQFPFRDLRNAITDPEKWGTRPNSSNYDDYAGYDRAKAQYAKVMSFRYLMGQDPADASEADWSLSSVDQSYLIDRRFDRWMVNGLALIDYAIAYDILEGAGYFGENYAARTAILTFMLRRAQSLNAIAQNDRTVGQFWSDVEKCQTVIDIKELGIHWEICYPDLSWDNPVIQQAIFHGQINNIKMIVAASLGVAAHAGLTEPIASQPWLDFAEKNIQHFLLNRNTYPPLNGHIMETQNVDGAYPEGIEYLNYAAEGFVPFLIANRVNGGEDYSQDANFRKMSRAT